LLPLHDYLKTPEYGKARSIRSITGHLIADTVNHELSSNLRKDTVIALVAPCKIPLSIKDFKGEVLIILLQPCFKYTRTLQTKCYSASMEDICSGHASLE